MSTLNNCIVYFNAAYVGYNFIDSSLNFCCAAPLPPGGVGNITNAPAFLDFVNRPPFPHYTANLRLQSNSPCINAGNNAYASGSADLDGRLRIVSGTVDIGAYEYQGAAQGLFISWLGEIWSTYRRLR